MKKQFPFFMAVSAGLVLVYVIVQFAIPSNQNKQPEEICIKEGTTFSEAADLLEQKGYIRDANLFRILGRLTRVDRHMRAGYYSVDGSMTPWELFRQFSRGKLIEKDITILEGECLLEIRNRLVGKGLITPEDFDRLSSDPVFIKSLGVEGPSLEGYLFPDTYRFPKGTAPDKLISTMVSRLMQLYNGELMARTNEMGLSMNTVLTLASIIEKEAGMDFERPIISAVFYNRLKRGMPLQADPTAIYGIKPPRSTVRKHDLLKRTKYNTYRIRGLPPGPIASPGFKSIRAALYPAKVPYLYFVSNHDGTHTFSTNYEDHMRAIENVKLKLAAGLVNGPGSK